MSILVLDNFVERSIAKLEVNVIRQPLQNEGNTINIVPNANEKMMHISFE